MDPTVGSYRHLSTLANLRILTCTAKYIPKSLESLPHLHAVQFLPQNFHTKSWKILPKLSNLTLLDFHSCNLPCVPEVLGQLSRLRTLCLMDNPALRSDHMSVLSPLTSLEKLNLRGLALIPVPRELTTLTALTWLDMGRPLDPDDDWNGDWGDAGDWEIEPYLVTHFTRLQRLSLEGHTFTGFWELPPSLTWLDMTGNEACDGWREILALPRLDYLKVSVRVPYEVRRHVRQVVEDLPPDCDTESEYLSDD